MGGYKVKRTTYKLAFEDDDLDGLEVTVRSISLARFLTMVDVQKLQALQVGALTLEDRELIERLFDQLARSLVAWNLEEEDGTPIPPTRDSIFEGDVMLMCQIVMAWVGAMVSVPTPLGPNSNDGPRFPEASIPMAPLSENPLS